MAEQYINMVLTSLFEVIGIFTISSWSTAPVALQSSVSIFFTAPVS